MTYQLAILWPMFSVPTRFFTRVPAHSNGTGMHFNVTEARYTTERPTSGPLIRLLSGFSLFPQHSVLWETVTCQTDSLCRKRLHQWQPASMGHSLFIHSTSYHNINLFISLFSTPSSPSTTTQSQSSHLVTSARSAKQPQLTEPESDRQQLNQQ